MELETANSRGEKKIRRDPYHTEASKRDLTVEPRKGIWREAVVLMRSRQRNSTRVCSNVEAHAALKL